MPETADAYVQVAELPPDAKLTPRAWAIRQGIKILSADGWDIDGRDFWEPITEAEFNERAALSTIRFPALRPQ